MTPFSNDTLKNLSAENATLQKQIFDASTAKQKLALFEKSLANKETAIAELEGKMQRLEQEKKQW